MGEPTSPTLHSIGYDMSVRPTGNLTVAGATLVKHLHQFASPQLQVPAVAEVVVESNVSPPPSVRGVVPNRRCARFDQFRRSTGAFACVARAPRRGLSRASTTRGPHRRRRDCGSATQAWWSARLRKALGKWLEPGFGVPVLFIGGFYSSSPWIPDLLRGS